MTNPFDTPDGRYLVLANHEDQHSIWPSYLDLPGGWEHRFGPAARHECLDYVERNWPDITPRSRIRKGGS
ncbi:MbtH family protein [Amycolatopsis antarctica]|uniref:MbtH family protein n=2 Tax=Amycolatopsis antarctica TaxID=1854586 RepID=A0A263D8W6_9PSEU|nr:MbtH family protein [Amycolatopsis antarctica]OZM74639.1 MbtH family protein [Amycolatopsis antarctica]